MKKLLAVILTTVLLLSTSNIYASDFTDDNGGFELSAAEEQQTELIENEEQEDENAIGTETEPDAELLQEIEKNETIDYEDEFPEFETSRGKKAGTIKLEVINPDSTVYTANLLEYAVVYDNNPVGAKWKKFKKNKYNVLDNINALTGNSIIFRRAGSKTKPALIFESTHINREDIQYLAKPKISVKTYETGRSNEIKIVFGKYYEDYEFTFESYNLEYNGMGEFYDWEGWREMEWEECPNINSESNSLTIYRDAEVLDKLYIRKKETENQPCSLPLIVNIKTSYRTPMSGMYIEETEKLNQYMAFMDYDEDEFLNFKYQYAIISSEKLDVEDEREIYRIISKASWKNIAKESFILPKLKPGEYEVFLRTAKNKVYLASEAERIDSLFIEDPRDWE